MDAVSPFKRRTRGRVDRKVLGRADKTLERYEQLRDLYGVPHLGAIPLGKLKPARIAEWRDLLLERGGAKGKGETQGRPPRPRASITR